MSKKLKYSSVKKNISSYRAMSNAIVLLNEASEGARANEDYKAMAYAGLGWAELFRAVIALEEDAQSPELIIEEALGRADLSPQVGFGPGPREDEEEIDED